MRATRVLRLAVWVGWLITTAACAVGAEEKAKPPVRAARRSDASRSGPAKVLYVAPGGSDTGAGTKDRPLATLEAARDAVRKLKAAGPLPAGGVRVRSRGCQRPRIVDGSPPLVHAARRGGAVGRVSSAED